MRFFYFLFPVLMVFSQVHVSAQTLISFEKIKSFSIEDLEEKWKELGIPKLITPIRYPVDIYNVWYYTKWHDGSPIVATGMYFVPVQNEESVATAVYNHGTVTIPGRNYDYNGESDICIFFATDGYAVAWPDYIGLGFGEKFHLYQHADSEGQAGVDLLRAIREINPELNIVPNNQLFITGYSQGGHSTMALHKKIEEEYATEFKITASSPMSGAYDLAGVQSVTMFKEYTQPHYLPYLLYGYNEVYDLWQGDINEIFKPPYDTIIPKYFDKQHSIGEINAILPSVPKDMIIDSLVDEFKENPDFPFTKALEENSLHNWKPEAPMQICYCTSDEEVYYMNAIVAHENMKELGAKYVTLRRTSKKFNHFDCAGFSAIYTKYYFDSFRKGKKKGKKGPAFKRFIISLAKLFTKAS